jgi:hypothetical protein
MASIDTAYIDYRQLITSLDSAAESKDTIYEDIMNKEKNRIDLINRVVEQKNTQIWAKSFFLKHSIIEIAILFATNWSMMIEELIHIKSIDKLEDIFYDGDRKIYSGLMLVLISMFLFLIEITA